MVLNNFTKQDFSRYGTVLSIPNDNLTSTDTLQYWRGISSCTMEKMTSGLLKVFPRVPVIDELERHVNTNEIVTVLSGSGVMGFAEPGEAHLESLKFFRVKQGDSFNMHPGTWHSILLPDNQQDALLLILFKDKTEDVDLDFRSLSEPIKINLN